MGSSLRRKKRARPLIKKKRNKRAEAKKKMACRVPPNLARGLEKLDADSGDWNERVCIGRNYAELGLVGNPNAFQRRELVAPEGVELDDDLKAAMSQARSTGAAPPSVPTERQRAIVDRLVAKHGDNTFKMMLDRKLNAMQHSESQLRDLIKMCEYWKPGTRITFHAPQKSLRGDGVHA